MKTLSSALAIATMMIAAPAAARDRSPYVGIDGGLLVAHDVSLDFVRDGEVIADEYIQIDHRLGYDLDLVAGYDFGLIRAEAELSRKRAAHDHYIYDQEGMGVEFDEDDGFTSVTSVMANLMLDFGDDDLAFSVGGGLGVAWTKMRVDRGFSAADTFTLKDNRLAWQLVAGLRKAVTANIDAGIKYRYFDGGRIQDDDGLISDGDSYRGDFSSHSFMASLIYNFGSVAPPPPPPMVVAPPPAPLPPATQNCADGSVILASEICPAPPPAPAPERG